MKFSKTTGIVALGLASNAIADNTWGEWDPTTEDATSTTTTTTTTTSTDSTWADWTSSSVDPTTTSSSSSWEDWSSTSVDPTSTSSSVTWEDWSSTSVDATSTDSASTTWEDWSSTVVDPTSTTSWEDWSSSSVAAASKPVTVTVTTTVYASTIFVGPGPATTVTVCGGSTIPAAPASDTWAAPVAPASGSPSGSWSAPVAPASGSPAAPASGSWSAPVAPASGSPAAGSWPSSVTPAADSASTGAWTGPDWDSLDAGTDTIVATGDAVYTWTGEAPTGTKSYAAPKYTGWSDWTPGSNGSTNGTGPAPGSSASNLTTPITGLPESSCNSAADRSVWCDGKSSSTDTVVDDYSTGHTCSYDLTITNTTLNFDGTPQLALAINGQVPGPLIECNWGDIISVKVTNLLQDNATSIHWHGIRQKATNDQDGVPGITECAIAPGSSRTYTFKASSYGTGWYHSHFITQYGDGIRGPMIIHGPATANYDIDMGTVMIDDTFPNGYTAAEYNSIIAHVGPGPTANYLLNGQNTKPDLSAGKHTLWSVEAGKKHRFRIINSASQNMWSVHFDNHKMTVIAADYVPIVPYETEWLNIAIGQRFDVIVEMNQPVAGYFLRAVTQTGCPSGCFNSGLGNANGIFLYKGAPNTLPTSTPGNVTAANFAICADEPLSKLKPFVSKSAGSPTTFAASASGIPAGAVANVSTSDDGYVFRWFINNGAIDVDYTNPTLKSVASGSFSNGSISNPITLGSANVWVYFVIQNQFFASHPMHLHGHDFALLGQGNVPWDVSLVGTLNFDSPMRRDTAMLAGSPGPQAPPGYTVIGFETDNPGAWLMHCHIVWHVDGGLALQFIERPSDISSYATKPEFQSECSNMAAYEAQSPAHNHNSGESGLKRRTYMDTLLNQHNDVVRRSDSAEKRYLESNLKRGFGDGYKPRHGARR